MDQGKTRQLTHLTASVNNREKKHPVLTSFGLFVHFTKFLNVFCLSLMANNYTKYILMLLFCFFQIPEYLLDKAQ